MIFKKLFLVCAFMTVLNNSLCSVSNPSINFKPSETDRLIIRGLDLSDAQGCFNLFSDKELSVMMPLPFHENIEQTAQFIQKNQQDHLENNVAWLAVVEKTSNRIIGMVIFDDYAPKFYKTGIAYVFAKEFWSKGYATEASKALVEFVFEKMGLNRVHATVDPENMRSIRVLEKLGMQCEGYLRQNVIVHGKFRDRKIYAILKNDWLADHNQINS